MNAEDNMSLFDLVVRFSVATTYAQVIAGCIACIAAAVWLTGQITVAAVALWGTIFRIGKHFIRYLKLRDRFEWWLEKEEANKRGQE